MQLNRTQGLTLLELTIAMAIFAVAFGATAQALASFFVYLDVQAQRQVAIRDCQGILDDMRAVRAQNPDDFPGAVTSAYPNGGVVAGTRRLLNEKLTVVYANPASNPLTVTVWAQWSDLRGRPVKLSLSSVLTDQ